MQAIIYLIIVTFLLYEYVKKKNDRELKKISDELNLSIDQINKICENIKQEFQKYNFKVECKWFGDNGEKKVNANSGIRISRKIYYKETWINKLINKDEYWRIAFLHTIGHEIGHKDREPIGTIIYTNKGRFRNWVRECRADFYGIQFVEKEYGITKNKILKAIKLKIDYNAPDEYAKQKSYLGHPSWNLRFKLLTEYMNFNEDVIRYIAKEAGITDEKYIKKVIRKAAL